MAYRWSSQEQVIRRLIFRLPVSPRIDPSPSPYQVCAVMARGADIKVTWHEPGGPFRSQIGEQVGRNGQPSPKNRSHSKVDPSSKVDPRQMSWPDGLFGHACRPECVHCRAFSILESAYVDPYIDASSGMSSENSPICSRGPLRSGFEPSSTWLGHSGPDPTKQRVPLVSGTARHDPSRRSNRPREMRRDQQA